MDDHVVEQGRCVEGQQQLIVAKNERGTVCAIESIFPYSGVVRSHTTYMMAASTDKRYRTNSNFSSQLTASHSLSLSLFSLNHTHLYHKERQQRRVGTQTIRGYFVRNTHQTQELLEFSHVATWAESSMFIEYTFTHAHQSE